jgi:guanylate kinase
VRERYPELHVAVSATTRAPRVGEIKDVSYYYMTDEVFRKLVSEDAFIEWAEVHEHCYGSLKSEVDPYLEAGRSVVLEIDVQGAFNIRDARPDAVLLFIEPPSYEVLEQRLRGRRSETEEQLIVRLRNARAEMALAGRYDERIVNDVLEDAVRETLALIRRYESEEGVLHGSDQA